MSLTGTEIEKEYQGNGVTTVFPITFALHDNTQLSVKLTDTTTDPDTETLLVEGLDYSVSGNPATQVTLAVAPTSNELLTVYRVTPRTQIYDFLDTGSFKAEDFEKAIDRITMMIQELDEGILASAPAGAGKYTRLAAQAIVSSGTIGVGTAQRMLKNVQGDAAAVFASTTSPVDAGGIDGQELRLVGASDSQTLTILESSTGISLNGDITFNEDTVLDLYWDQADAEWKETGRRE
jgi:hypothetical protein